LLHQNLTSHIETTKLKFEQCAVELQKKEARKEEEVEKKSEGKLERFYIIFFQILLKFQQKLE
jgi:hypothetical protein